MTLPQPDLATALSDRYRIERELGAGGMATVYLAEDLKHRRRVAVKVLRPELAAVLGGDRFLKEIEVTANLQHPHILGLFDSGAADSFLYYVMPYVEGETLRQRLAREKMLPVDEALRLASQIASALDYAHRRGVVHRDIKPENILLQDGEVLLADFGIALAVQEAGGDRLTQTGLSLGTPQYMSPEQATGEHDPDARSDVYSLAAVTYEMLAGEPPVTGPNARAMIAKLLTEKPVSPRVMRDSVSPEIDAAIMRGLAKTPADRFATAKDFAAAVGSATSTGTTTRAATAESPVPVAPSAPAPTRRSMSVLAIGGAVVGVVVIGGLIFAARRGTSSAPGGGATAAITSVAVLPFVERASTGNEYLGDGMAETLIYALGKVPGLDVAAQTSSFAFRGKETDLATIGKQLGVGSVLTGSLQRSGDQLRVLVRLERVSDHRELWTERFDSDVKNLFALQDSIGRAVVGRLQASPNVGRATTIVDAGTKNVDAYQAYLQGRLLWGQRGEGIKKGLAYFERAVALDSSYALAWTGIADCYALLNIYGDTTAEAIPKAKRALDRALALDSTLAGPHATRGLILHTHDYDWAGAEREFRRAIALDPKYVPAHYWLGNLLSAVYARNAEAIDENRRAVALDPLSGHATYLLGFAFIVAGDADSALAAARRSVSLLRSWNNYRGLGIAYREAKRYRESLAALDSGLAIAPGHLWLVSQRGITLAAMGDTAGAVRIYNQLLPEAIAGRIQPLPVAWVAAATGRANEALALTERALETRDANLAYPQVRSFASRFTTDPRFVAFWRRLGVTLVPTR